MKPEHDFQRLVRFPQLKCCSTCGKVIYSFTVDCSACEPERGKPLERGRAYSGVLPTWRYDE